MNEFVEVESSEELTSGPDGALPQTSVGTMLAEARRKLGIEVDKIANRLNLGAETIRAIESGNKANLPPRPFLQGHIRSYAKLVELDLSVILPLWEKECPPIVPEKIVPMESDKRIRRMHRNNRRSSKGGKRKRALLITAFLLLIVVIGFGLLSTMEKTSLSPADTSTSAAGASMKLPLQAATGSASQQRGSE